MELERVRRGLDRQEQKESSHLPPNSYQVQEQETTDKPELTQRYKVLYQTIGQQVSREGISGKAAEEEIAARFFQVISGLKI
jgi:hypothetical protein